MDNVLDDTEVRILGCLMEKEMATPEYYPLSLNALCSACNQKSNRNPVLSLEESVVERGLDSLRRKGLARETHTSGSRVPRYLHALLDRFDLSRPEMAVLCELMLRGSQTAGEVRSNAERMSPLGSLGDVEETLRGLMEHDPPLVEKLPRETGRKESRFAHLFAGASAQRTTLELSSASADHAPADEALSRLEGEVARLRSELEELKQAFSEFKAQF